MCLKSLLILILVAFLSIGCAAQKPIDLKDEKPPEPPKEKKSKIKIKKLSVKEKLKYYFISREVKPSVIVNNVTDSMLKNGEEVVNIADHKVVWDFSSDKETKIKIDGDAFSLKNQKTLNIVDSDKASVDFTNDWDQIKLFEFGDRKLIGISMVNNPCTGIGCRVMNYLIYDLKTKNKTFFGTYRFALDREFGLFDFGNDGTLDFLSGTYDDGNDGKGIEFKNIYQIFTMDDKGFFHVQTDIKGKPYFMKRVYKEDDYEEIDAKFEHYWIEEIK